MSMRLRWEPKLTAQYVSIESHITNHYLYAIKPRNVPPWLMCSMEPYHGDCVLESLQAT